jgi:Secretion system C-terminal sorting domain
MRLIATLFLVHFLVLTTRAQHTNIQVSNLPDNDEPSIVFDLKNPKYMVAGANISYSYRSQDTGRTWDLVNQTSPYGVWGDPCMVVDTAGNFYHFHLANTPNATWIDRIVCQKSTDKGVTWNAGSFMGLNGTKQQDKHWATVNRKTNAIYVTWTQFDKYDSVLPADSSHILFSKSLDAGSTWSSPIRLDQKGGDCIDKDKTVEGAVTAIGPTGQLYTTWASEEGLIFDRSLDGGQTWLTNDIKVTNTPEGWDYNVSGLYRCNGLPITACDTSTGPYRGTIYINWTDQRNGVNNTDVWLSKSIDGGNTWSSPTRVNNDLSNRHQFLTWMTIDQTNGYLYFIFYDRRNYSDDRTDVYMAVSRDGGRSFTNFKISETPFLPISNQFFGDYTNIVAHNGIIRPIWARMESNGAKSIWTALVNTNLIADTKEAGTKIQMATVEVYPNPSNGLITFDIQIDETRQLNLRIIDQLGRNITNLFTSKQFQKGRFKETFDCTKLGMSAGIYHYILEDGEGHLMSGKIVLDK